MNRRFYILTLASVFCCLLLYTLYPALRLSNVYNTQRTSTNEKNSYFKMFEKKSAFATIVCDPQMMEATMVSIYSLSAAYANKPSSKLDIIVLLPESVPFQNEDIQNLEKLGARIVRTSFPQQLDPQDSDVYNAIVNLWALFDYQKIVYFTPEILFDNNVDHLFNYPAGSALTNDINTALFVLEPHPNSFEILIRDYRQFVKSKHSTFAQLLQQVYLNYSLRIPADSIKKNAQIFIGPMKPWNFHAYGDVDWKKQYDPISFYKWRRTANDVRHLLRPQSTWKNQARQHTVCDSYLESKSDINTFPVQDQFSVMISTYNPDRIEHLSLIIQHLLKSSKVHTIFVTWHNPALQVPDSLYQDIQEKDYSRLKVLSQTFDSLNNRFNPVDELQTEAVYIMDDDVYVDLDDLEFTFSVWQSRKDSVVGHFPRMHTYNATTHEATYELIGKAPYSIVLTKSMFIRSDYLFSFTCLLEPKLHETVDSQLNCEDLGFSMMASGMSGAAPTYVRPLKTMQDFGLKKGISANTAHMPARSQCISDFITDYWNEKDPLVLAYDTVAPFEKPQIIVGNWKLLEKIILNH